MLTQLHGRGLERCKLHFSCPELRSGHFEFAAALFWAAGSTPSLDRHLSSGRVGELRGAGTAQAMRDLQRCASRGALALRCKGSKKKAIRVADALSAVGKVTVDDCTVECSVYKCSAGAPVRVFLVIRLLLVSRPRERRFPSLLGSRLLYNVVGLSCRNLSTFVQTELN